MRVFDVTALTGIVRGGGGEEGRGGGGGDVR